MEKRTEHKKSEQRERVKLVNGGMNEGRVETKENRQKAKMITLTIEKTDAWEKSKINKETEEGKYLQI